MGADQSDPAADPEDGPLRIVELSSFAIQKSPVTVGQWKHFLAETSFDWAFHKEVQQVAPGDDFPIVFVSWFDALAFAGWLAEASGRHFALPTEAQWERACRGTDGRLYPWGNGERDWVEEMTADSLKPIPVGTRADLPSAIGCLDMWFNVREWCSDWYDDELCEVPIETLEKLDPKGPPEGEFRVLRGGHPATSGWPRCCARRAAKPDFRSSIVGFRLVENGLDAA